MAESQCMPMELLWLSIPFLDQATLLRVTLLSHYMYNAAVPHAYRSLSIRGSEELRRLDDMVTPYHASSQRSYILSHVRRLTLALRSTTHTIPVPTLNLGMLESAPHNEVQPDDNEEGLSDTQTAGWSDSPQSSEAHATVSHNIPSDVSQSVRSEITESRGDASQSPTSDGSRASDNRENDSDDVDTSSDPSLGSPSANSQTEAPRGPEPLLIVPSFISSIPEIFRSTWSLRNMVRKVYIDRQNAVKRRQSAVANGLDLSDFRPLVPFSQLQHLIISPLEFPARGATEPPSPMSPFLSVDHLELHFTSGLLLSQVWNANMRELWQYAPLIKKLSFVFEDSYIFKAQHIHLASLPPWQRLESVHIHVKQHYCSYLEGPKWQFIQGIGEIWTRQILNRFNHMMQERAAYIKANLKPGFPVHLPIRRLTLHFPAESLFNWNPSQLLADFQAEHASLLGEDRLTVTFLFDEGPEESPGIE